MKNRITWAFASMFILIIVGCEQEEEPLLIPTESSGDSPIMRIENIITQDSLIINPGSYSPLTALLHLKTNKPASLTTRLLGKYGPLSDVTYRVNSQNTQFKIPVLGLYPGFVNTLRIKLHDSSGIIIDTLTYEIETPPLPGFLPDLVIKKADRKEMIPGMTLVSYFGGRHGVFPQTPFMFDSFGDIRWYVDFSDHPDLHRLFYDVGIERLANGHFYFGDGHTDKIYEMDWFGQIRQTWDMPGFNFHHNVQEKPNGNFLVSVNKNGLGTIEDHVIEIDRQENQIIRVWNLLESLQYDRRTLINNNTDWLHVNAVIYDPHDGNIIVSGRHQGVVKLTPENEVVWLLAIHNGWDKNGRGEDLNPYLLHPLDADGDIINSASVLQGYDVHPDFEWNWYQHAPLLKPNGHIMLFDNGENRNFSSGPRYSRAVEYAIDETNKTVRQVWSYGKERGQETYSRIVSDVDYYPDAKHVVFSPGSPRINNLPTGKVIEMDYQTQQIYFEADIRSPQAPYGIVFHRTERVKLYE